MKYVLGLLGALSLLVSLGTCVTAKSAIHETYSAALFVAGVAGLGFAALLNGVDDVQKKLSEINTNIGDNFMYLGKFLSEQAAKINETKK